MKCEVLQFASHFAHTETVGNRGVNLQSFPRNTLAPLGTEKAESPHIMQTVGQFHDDDADVVHHREKHLAVALRLPVFGGKEVDFAELGYAIDALRDFIAEVLLNVRGGDGSVFDDVVQQSRLDTDNIHAHPRQNASDGQRVAHIGLARRSFLTGMVLGGELIRLLDGSEIVFRTRFPHRHYQFVELIL